MHDADDFYIGSVNAMKHDVIVHNQHAGFRRNFRAGCSEVRMVGQIAALTDEAIDQPISGGWIVQGDAQPDLVEIGTGARRSGDTSHA